MYLRPDEVARVLEKVGFTVDVVTQKAYGYRRGENYVYVNREARMGRTALVIHPTLKERSSTLAEPASDIKTCDHYQQFPLYLAGERHEHYGIPLTRSPHTPVTGTSHKPGYPPDFLSSPTG